MPCLPNEVSCTNGQHREGKSVPTFSLKETDRKRHQAWVKILQRHRPRWSSTKLSFLCSHFFSESCFTKNREIPAKLGINRKLKPDAFPTINFSLADTVDTIDQSLTDRAKRQVRLIYVLVFRPWSSSKS